MLPACSICPVPNWHYEQNQSSLNRQAPKKTRRGPFYCFRRGTASKLAQLIGGELTKHYLQHKEGSATLDKHYSNATTSVNPVAAVTEGEVRSLEMDTETTSPALFAYVLHFYYCLSFKYDL
jgi:hypothetical protein